MAFDLSGLLQQYVGKSGQVPENAADHFQQAAQAASPQMVSHGLAEAFRSDQTPPFAQMVAQLFSQANPQQQAGMLNQLVSSLSPAALAAITSGGALGGFLLEQGGGGQPATIAPQDAAQMTPEEVQQIASHAEQHSPGIIDQMSNFYAQHSGLVKTLGGAALAIALAKMANANRS